MPPPSLSAAVVLILGFANLLADGFSMSISDYLSTRAKQQYLENIRKKETKEITKYPKQEKAQLRKTFAKKGFKGDGTKVILEAANLAPAIGSKLRKIYSAYQTYQFDKDIIKNYPLNVKMLGKFNPSPTYNIIGNLTSATLNIPLDRAISEARALSEVLDSRNTKFQRLALSLGWRTWDVNAKNEEGDLIKTIVKLKRKQKKAAERKLDRKILKQLNK